MRVTTTSNSNAFGAKISTGTVGSIGINRLGLSAVCHAVGLRPPFSAAVRAALPNFCSVALADFGCAFKSDRFDLVLRAGVFLAGTKEGLEARDWGLGTKTKAHGTERIYEN